MSVGTIGYWHSRTAVKACFRLFPARRLRKLKKNRRPFPRVAVGIFMVDGYSTVSNSCWVVELWVGEYRLVLPGALWRAYVLGHVIA